MKINDREYTIPELNFNAMCELEDLGASFSEMDKKVLSTVRAFLALAMGGDAEKAGKRFFSGSQGVSGEESWPRQGGGASGASKEPAPDSFREAVSREWLPFAICAGLTKEQLGKLSPAALAPYIRAREI